MRMIQRGEQLRFALEPREAIGIGCERVRQDFDSDFATEPGVASPIDLSHAADAEGVDDLVDAQPCSGRESHVCAANYSGGFRRSRGTTDATGAV